MRRNECIDRLEFDDKPSIDYQIGDEISHDVPLIKNGYGLFVLESNLRFGEF